MDSSKNDKYTINIDFSASYGDDDADATVSIRDSNGLNVSSHKYADKDDKIDDILAGLFDDIVGKILSKKEPKSKEDELQAKLDSALIDNKVLKARLEKLQEAYDAQVKAYQRPTVGQPYAKCAPEKPFEKDKPKCGPVKVKISEKPTTKASQSKNTAYDRKRASDAIFDDWYGRFLDNFLKL